jgi:hypothetical protein
MNQLMRQLRSWQRREWLYSACVAVAIVVVFVALGIANACLIDYYQDLERDTPFWLRVSLVVCQILAYILIVVSVAYHLRAPSIISLASRAEYAHPDLDHRLVTSLQLNRPDARTDGMSPELIQNVTMEAGQLSQNKRLASLASPNRLWIATVMILPVVLGIVLAFLFFRPLVTALLQRQLLQSVDIPREVTIENATAPLHPTGDGVEIRLRVSGRINPKTVGNLFVTPDGGPTEQHELAYSGPLDGDDKLFVAQLPPASVPFEFTARLGDGRLKHPGRIEFASRPTVTDVSAWVIQPAYVDPDGKRRYETLTNQGDLQAHADCSARIVATSSKPLKTATIVLMGEMAEQKRSMTVSDDGLTASITLDMPGRSHSYRIEVADENEFANLIAPRRGIRLIPDRAPQVELNDEVLMPGWETGPIEDFEVRGMPLVIGGQIQIGYSARSPLGLSKAFVIYRVNDGAWTALPLTRLEADESKVGKFRSDLGVFSSYDVDRNVEFYPRPASDPETEPSGLSAGGRYNFQTAALGKPGVDGAMAKLELGDRVEYRIGVYDRKPDRLIPVTDPETATQPVEKRGTPNRPAGYSDAKIKTVVTQAAFDQWRDQQSRSRDRLRELEKVQRGVFGQKVPK